MAKPTSSDPRDRAGLLVGTIRQVQFWWRLLRDRRVPPWTKSVPFLALLYILFPFDLVMDPILGLGQLDDLAILFIGMEVFVRLSPAEVVEEIWQEIHSGRRRRAGSQVPQTSVVPTVDASCRVVDDEPRRELPGEGATRTEGG
jgi:uncharacterized membrane protein YkvA (DUF1232 family)